MELEALFDVPQSAAVETDCPDNTSEAPQYQIKKMGSPLDSIWRNPKVCARVEELWKDHSSSQIASAISGEFSVTVTRNAVIGYLHRAKLTTAKKTKDHPQLRPKGSSRRKRTPAQFGAERRAANRLKAVKPTPFLVSLCDVEPRNISLMDLKAGDCRYPYGDGPFLFCGQPSVTGHSYCAGHCQVVYQPRRAA